MEAVHAQAKSDHPRIRGEHVFLSSSGSFSPGSSPHTRGALGIEEALVSGERIIPAYAGSTACCLRAAYSRRDHPRIRGEHLGRSGGRAKNVGSSPHTRGAPSDVEKALIASRIIPAYAGSTTSA